MDTALCFAGSDCTPLRTSTKARGMCTIEQTPRQRVFIVAQQPVSYLFPLDDDD